MQRIQARNLLIMIGASLILSGCFEDKKSDSEIKSVSFYIHDIDAAHARLHRAKLDGAKGNSDPEAINASLAYDKAVSSSGLKCWKVKPITTAGTDHECLEKLGFMR